MNLALGTERQYIYIELGINFIHVGELFWFHKSRPAPLISLPKIVNFRQDVTIWKCRCGKNTHHFRATPRGVLYTEHIHGVVVGDTLECINILEQFRVLTTLYQLKFRFLVYSLAGPPLPLVTGLARETDHLH